MRVTTICKWLGCHKTLEKHEGNQVVLNFLSNILKIKNVKIDKNKQGIINKLLETRNKEEIVVEAKVRRRWREQRRIRRK